MEKSPKCSLQWEACGNQLVKFLVLYTWDIHLVYFPGAVDNVFPLCILFTVGFAVSQMTANCTDCIDPSKHWVLDSCLAGWIFLMLLIMQVSKVLQFLFIPCQSFVAFLPVLGKSVRSSVLLAGLWFVLKSNVGLGLQKAVITAKAAYVSDMNSIVVSSQLHSQLNSSLTMGEWQFSIWPVSSDAGLFQIYLGVFSSSIWEVDWSCKAISP